MVVTMANTIYYQLLTDANTFVRWPFDKLFVVLRKPIIGIGP